MYLTSLLLGLLAHPAAASDTSLLSTVPENAFALLYCEDAAAFRERVERNDWVRLLGSEPGEPAFLEIESALRSGFDAGLRRFIDLGRELNGEGVVFVTPGAIGFIATPAGDREGIARAMRATLPVADGAVVRRDVELAGGRIHIAVLPPGPTADPGESEGRVRAFLDHPGALGLFAADDQATLVAAVHDAVTHLGEDRSAPLVRAFDAARRGVGPTGGAELFIDFSPFAERAQAALVAASGGFLFDPSELLGLERGTTLYATLDLWPGNRVECRARMAIPEETLAAKFADTFRPLPPDLPGKIPAGVWSANAIAWDIVGVYDIARASLEKQQKDKLETIDQGLEAASRTSGIDVENLMRQLAGVFALYYVEPTADDPPLTEFATFGFRLHVHDGDGFLDAAETIAGISLFDIFDQVELEGFDAFVVGDRTRESDEAVGWPERFDGGLAFLPDACVFATDRGLLEQSLRAHGGVEGASLLDDGRFRAAFDENQGGCFLVCMDLDALQRIAFPGLGADPSLPPVDADGAATHPFRAQLVATARRTAKGFDFRLYTR